MDKKVLYLIDLYDYYSPLLTEKQRLYFEDYYFNNLSLAEISENQNTSRNAIYKQIKDVENKMIEYENKLNLYEKGKKVRILIKELDQKTKEMIEELI